MVGQSVSRSGLSGSLSIWENMCLKTSSQFSIDLNETCYTLSLSNVDIHDDMPLWLRGF